MVRVLILENDNGRRWHTIRRFIVHNIKREDDGFEPFMQIMDYDKVTDKHSQTTTCISREDIKKMYEFLEEK